MDVRACRDVDELRGAMGAISHFFGSPPSDEWVEASEKLLGPERMHGAFADGAAVGGAGAFPFELTVPGGRLRAAGITIVGVLPTHRRRGVLTEMMRAQLEDVRQRGESVAYLWASEGGIYGRFGYGIASLAGEIHIGRTRGAFVRPFEPVGTVRLVDRDEALELLPPVYERVAAETPGMFGRSREWWDLRVLADPESRRRGAGELQRVVLDVDGRPEAYALYRVKPSFEHFTSTGETVVVEAMGTTPVATRLIWRYLLDVDWMDTLRAWHLPVDHPLFFLLTEPRRMRYTAVDALWVRLVDVGAALSGRSYGSGDGVVFEVSDEFCPWNDGRWRLDGGEATRTDADADLRLDVTALGSVYLGGFTFGQLARALRVEELRDGAIARADALFHTDRAPWCPEIF